MEQDVESGRPALVLIVDDNLQNLKLLRSVLQQQEYKTALALNAGEAFAFLDTTIPDLILLDVMMPETSGYDIAKKIKLNFSLKEVPIIFLTAKTSTDDIVAGFDAGGVDYVTKPFNSRELLVRIQTHIALKRARDEIRTLRGILPVCANCKRIREDGGEWISLENYIRKHTEAEISHGMCMDCVEIIYPEIAWKIKKKQA
jgi:DNA-binding response OmpR family regulator